MFEIVAVCPEVLFVERGTRSRSVQSLVLVSRGGCFGVVVT